MTAYIAPTARVSGDARVSDNAEVYGNAYVSGNAYVHGNAEVYGNALVYDSARVYGNALVYGNARVSGDAHIEQTTDYLVLATPRGVPLTAHRDAVVGIRVNAGCWSGTLDDLRDTDAIAARYDHEDVHDPGPPELWAPIVALIGQWAEAHDWTRDNWGADQP